LRRWTLNGDKRGIDRNGTSFTNQMVIKMFCEVAEACLEFLRGGIGARLDSTGE
jgi:hypothetical protein